MIRRLLFLLVLLTAPARAATFKDLLFNTRMILQDKGIPRAFSDSEYYYIAANTLQYVGTRSLSVVVDTTVTLTGGVVQYTLNRVPLKMVTAFAVSQSGAVVSVAKLPHDDIWKSDQEKNHGYSIGADNSLFVTKKLSYEYQLRLHYVATPTPLARDSSTSIDLPPGLLTALYYQTAADLLDATRAGPNVAVASKHSARATEIIGVFLVAGRGERLDSLAIK